uniref:Uncharacterized protein n=1 Tax=Schizophyllum commune (strain H4-8 / FGSC 9210) TaxID=578458 RepID=D8Q2L5_SCHCM
MREAERGAMLQQKSDAGERTPRPTAEHATRSTAERAPRPATEGSSRPSTSPAPAPSPARNRVKRRTEDTRPSTATDNAEEQLERPTTPPTPIGITGGTFGFSNSPTKRKPALNDMSVLHEVTGKGKARAVDQERARAVEETDEDVVIAVASEGRVVRARSIGKGDAGGIGRGSASSTTKEGASSTGREGGSLRSNTHSADVPAASWCCFCDVDSICVDESISVFKYGDYADEWHLADLKLESGVDIGLQTTPTLALFFVPPTFREHLVFGAQDRDPAAGECEFAAPRHISKSPTDDKHGGRAAADDEHGGRARGIGFVATATAGHEFVVTHCAGAPGAGFRTKTVYPEDADVEGFVDLQGIAGATKNAGFEYEAENGKFVDERVGEDESVGSVARSAGRAVVVVVDAVGFVFAAVDVFAATGAQFGVVAQYVERDARVEGVAFVAQGLECGVFVVPDADPRWMSESDARRMHETEGRRALEGEPISLGVRGQQMLRSPESSAHTSRAPSPLARSASASVASLGQSGPGARGDRDVKPPPLSTTPAGALPQRGRGPHAGGVDLGTVEVVSRAARDVDPGPAYSPQRMVASASMGSPRHASLAPFPSSASVEAAEAPPRPKKSVRRTASMTLPSLLLHKPLMPSTLSPSLPSGLFTPRRDKSSSSSGSPQEASCSASLPGTPGPGTPSSGAGTPSTPSKSGLFGLGRSFGFGRKAKDELDAEREREKEREAEQVKEWEREREKEKRRPNVLKRRSSTTRSGLGAEIRVDSPPPQESMRLERIDSSGAEEQRLQEAEKEPAPIFGLPIDPRRGLPDEEPAAASLETPPRKAPIYESFRRREAPKETQRQDTLSPPPMSPPQNSRSLHRSPSSPMMMLNPWSPPSPQAPLPEPHHASTRSAGALSEMSRASSGKDASPRPSFSSDSRRSFSRDAHKRGHTPAVPSSSTFGPFGTLGPFDGPDAEGMPSRDRRDTGTSVGSRSTAMYTSDGRRDSEWESRRNTTFTIDDKLDSEVWRKTPTLSDRLSLTLDSYYVTPPSASANDEQDAGRGVASLDSTLDRPQTPTKRLARRPSMLDVNIESPEISMEGAFDSLASRQSKDGGESAPEVPPAETAKPEELESARTMSLEQARPLPSALTIQPSFRRVRAADEETLLIPPRESVATLSPSSASEGQPFTPVHAVHGEGFDMIARLAKEEAVDEEIEEVPRRERRGTVAGVEVEVSIGPSEAAETQQDERKPVQLDRAESPFGTRTEPRKIRTTPLVKGSTPKPEKEEGSPHLPYFTVFGGVSPLASTSSAFVTSAFGTKGSGPTSPNIFSSKRRPQSPRASSPPARPSHGTSKSYSEKGLARKLSTRYLRAHDDIDTYTKSSTSTPEKESCKSRSASYEEEARKSGERQRAQLSKRNRKSEPPGALLSAADGPSTSQNSSPGSGGSRIWRLVKRISTGALRDKADWDEESTKAPPVPAIPSHLREGSAFIGGPRQSEEVRSTKSKARPLPVNRPGNSSPEVESSVDEKFFAGTRRSSVSSVDPSDTVGKPILPPSELGRIAREMEAERQSTRERSKSSTSSNSMRSGQSTRTRSSSGRGQGHARTDTEFTIIATSPSEELTALTAPPPRRRKDDDLAEFGAAAADSPMIPSFSVDQPINAFNRAKMHIPSRSAQRNLSLPSASESPPSLPPPRSKTRPSLQETRETGRLQSPHAHSFSTSALKRSKAPPVTFRELGSAPTASRSLSEKEKAARWDDLLLMSERAGGTIHLGSEAPPDQFFLDGRQLVFAVAVKAPDESAHILLAVIEPGGLFSPVPAGPFPVDTSRGLAIDEKGNLRTLAAEDYQGLTALAYGVDAMQDPELTGSTWRMGSSPEDQSTYELSVPVPGRLQGLGGNPVLRQTRVYAYSKENTKLSMQLPPALVEIFELAEEARVDGEPNEDVIRWVKNTLSSTSIPNLTRKQVANAVAAIRAATSGHAHIAPVINLEPKTSYPPKETPRIPINGMLGVRIPGAPDVPGRHAVLDSLEPWSRPPNRRNWLGLGGLGEVWISYPVARAGKKQTMSTVRTEYGRDADDRVIPWPADATGVFYLDKDAPDATVRFRLTKTGEHAAFEQGEDLRGADGERWALRLHRPLQQGAVAKLPGIHERHHSVIRLLYDRRGRLDARAVQNDTSSPTPGTPPSSDTDPSLTTGDPSSTSGDPSSTSGDPSPPPGDPFTTSSSPTPAVPFRLPFPAGTVGYLYYHAHPEAPVTASGIRFRVVPDGKRWEEGWDLESAMGRLMGLGEGDAVGEGDAGGEEGEASQTRQAAEGHAPLVPWELTIAHAASFLGPWVGEPSSVLDSAGEPSSARESASESSSTLGSADAGVHREDGVGKVVDGDEEDAAMDDEDAALDDEDGTDESETSASTTDGGTTGSIPRRHYVLTPHTTRVMVDLTFGAWPTGSTGKILAKFEIADDGRAADGVLALRVLREIEPVVVPGVWEPTASDSTRLEGQILWRVPLDGPIPESTLLNMPRSVHVQAIFERARAAYFAQGLAKKEIKRLPGHPKKDGEDAVPARKEKLTAEEFDSKFPPIPRRGVCAPLDVAILNHQRAALRALALTKTQTDLTTWFHGGPDNDSRTGKATFDPTPLLAHRIADWVDPKSGLVRNIQEQVETDVDFLNRPLVVSRGPAYHAQRAGSTRDHPTPSRADPLGLDLTAVSLMGRRRARGAVARLRRKSREATLRGMASSEKALDHGLVYLASSVPPTDGDVAQEHQAKAQGTGPEVRERVTRARAERSAAWARVLEEYRARREQQEREKAERRKERVRRREEKLEEEQEKRRLRQQEKREKELLKMKQAEEREAREQEQREKARSAMAQRTRALDSQRLHLTRASQWLERAEAYLDEAEAYASGGAMKTDKQSPPLAGFAGSTSMNVALARATVLMRQASRHLVRARLSPRSPRPAVQQLVGPLERASRSKPPRARFVVSTLAADKITDLDRVDLSRTGQRKREAFIEWERRKMEVEMKQEDWVEEPRGRPTQGPGSVVLHHPEWTQKGMVIPANTLERGSGKPGARTSLDDGDDRGTDISSFPPAEGFFYWYEGPDGPPGLRFRLASKGTAFVNGQDWVPGGVDGVPWVYPATTAVRHGRLFPWLRADNVLSPAVEASASLALRRAWYKSGLVRPASHIVHHLLPQNLTEADRICFSGCTAAVAVSGAAYAMPNIELDRRRVKRRMACHSKRVAICVLVMGGGGLLTMGSRGEVSSLDPTEVKEDDRLILDGFKYYEAWSYAGVHRRVVRSEPDPKSVGGTMSAELRFRLVPPGTPFWDGRDLERAGKPWRCGLRLLCKWQPATMAALADAGHIPRAFYEEARNAVGLSRLHQGFVLDDDYDETGSRPVRWRYPSVMKLLALKDPRAARYRRRGPRVSYQRRVPRYKSPRRLSLMEHKQVSTLDPSKLTDADRVDARDLRGIILSVSSGADVEDKRIEVNILAPRTGRFPLDAIGFIYWHDPPNRPPWGGAFRFRVAPPGTAFADGHDLLSPSIGLPYEWGVSAQDKLFGSWALARFEHNSDDPNRLHLRIQKLLSPPVPRFPDYDGFVPPPREGELVMMNTETPWEYVYDRKRPFEDYATALDLFWTEATCRADYTREAGGEEQWKEEWVQPKRRTRGRKKYGR